MTFAQVQANTENTQIAAIVAIDQATQPSFNGFGPSGEQVEIQQNDGQGQAVEALHGMQAGALQIHPVVFQIAKGFLDPHAPAIGAQGGLVGGQIGGQEPGLLFPDLPAG